MEGVPCGFCNCFTENYLKEKGFDNVIPEHSFTMGALTSKTRFLTITFSRVFHSRRNDASETCEIKSAYDFNDITSCFSAFMSRN